MKKSDDIPVIRAVYEMLVWALPVVAQLPRAHRYVLGERAEKRMLDVLEALLAARYSRQPAVLLQKANAGIDILRYEVRLMHDLRMISNEQYGKFCERMLDIGKQVGGWRKSLGRNSLGWGGNCGWICGRGSSRGTTSSSRQPRRGAASSPVLLSSSSSAGARRHWPSCGMN